MAGTDATVKLLKKKSVTCLKIWGNVAYIYIYTLREQAYTDARVTFTP